ncbi:MAG: phosphatase [Marinilabiliaceae bacterium]
MRVAIIDIGTNTINLLVADTKAGGSYNIISSTKVTARLGQGGINDGRLTPEAIKRGMEAIDTHMKTLASLGKVDKIVAIGTSAMRNAANADEFAKAVEEKYGFGIRIISGDEEARMIFDGVKQVMPLGLERVLILDIGGGSCEFIIANKDGVAWAHSYELGMARILDKFHPSDPITHKEIMAIEAYIRQGLSQEGASLYDAIRNFPTSTLVGTSGTFDTVAALVAARNHPLLNVTLSTSYEIPMPSFDETFRKLINSTVEERRAMPSMDKGRVDLIVPGAIFVNFVLTEMKIERLYQCGFALKQGSILNFAKE